ncbi:MAG: cell division protein ZapB [Treponemataceae bacterium]|nr:cell division protein ZapB [Treponemataceae bacterium]
MVSLDQVLLLEQKVESAVQKIAQLRAENDALRSKCAELTNALSSKSELLSSFEQDQNRIEDGIKSAIDRLNSIENAVLNASACAAPEQPAHSTEAAQIPPVQQPQQEAPAVLPEPSAVQSVQPQQPAQDSAMMQEQPDAAAQIPAMQELPPSDSSSMEQDMPPQDAALQNSGPENGQFDIF